MAPLQTVQEGIQVAEQVAGRFFVMDSVHPVIIALRDPFFLLRINVLRDIIAKMERLHPAQQESIVLLVQPHLFYALREPTVPP